jgi:peptidoglycan hydrolase-like protein with peptidoglycan-binding domain
MRDILDDDERKVKPLSMLMITTAAVLGSMIVYNAMWGQGAATRAGLASAPGATTHMEVSVPADASNTVVIKYDPVVEDVQRELLALGQYKGMVDGVIGQRTIAAVQQYQQANGLTVTGQVSAELANHIRYTRKVKAASEFTGSIDPAPTISKRQSISIAQAALAKMGYDLGEPSGSLDETTKAAILQFEMENGLNMDGDVGPELLSALITAQ